MRCWASSLTASRRKSISAPALSRSSWSAMLKSVATIGFLFLRFGGSKRMEPDRGHSRQESSHAMEFTPLPGTLISQQQAYARLNRVRENAAEPIWETLPFEARCDACGERAAEWQKEVAGETRWLCSVCYQRDEVGRSERYRLPEQVWDDVGVNPAALIRPPEDQENWTGPVPPSLDELVPEKDRRRRWIAMVYGDGNNFGGIVQRLRGVVDQLHWSRRLYWTVRGLTELALAEAVRFFAADGSTPAASRKVRFAYYPFEILTIGGDDVAFFAWAPVALKAVERLQAFLTREFAQAAGTGPDAWPPVTFSFGIAIADSHTPARRLQEVAEDVLL